MSILHCSAAARRGVSAIAVVAGLIAAPAAAQSVLGTVTGAAGLVPGTTGSGTSSTPVATSATGSTTTSGTLGGVLPGVTSGTGGTVAGTVGTVLAGGTSAPATGTAVTGTVGGVLTGTGVTVPAAVTGVIGTGLAATGAGGVVATAAPATVAVANSVALGDGSVAARGGQTAYAALRLATPQASAGEVSVGLAGLERQITNVAAGSAPTDAVNVAQLAALGYDVDNLAAVAVRYDSTGLGRVVLGNVGQAVNLANVAAGQVALGSLDAVNGGQLFAVDAQVTVNAAAIAGLQTQLANLAVTIGGGTGGTGGTVVIGGGGQTPVQYANAATPTTPNGGTVSNDVTMVGADGGPVAVHNVAAGQVAAGSTDAVNGGQLYATNVAVAAAQGDATAALAMGRNSVQYDNAQHTDITLGDGAAPVALHNVAPGTAPTDAVNVAQLNASSSATLGAAKDYTDSRIAAMNYDIDKVRRDANGGTTMALAAAALPQPYQAGKGMLALAGGTYRGEAAFALGASKAFVDGHTVLKMGATYGTHASVGASAGVGYQF